MTLRVIQVSTL